MTVPPPRGFQVRTMRHEADGVVSLELTPCDGPLPQFAAGAHVDLHLGNGLVRSYSLMNGPDERGHFSIGVFRDPDSTGGSLYIHDRLRVGQIIPVGEPRNNFALAGDAAHSVFIAGGIGVTPFLAMAAQLNATGKPWTLHYSCRNRGRAAFLDRLDRLAGAGDARLVQHYDDEADGRFLDIQGIVDAAAPGTHFYCCGPSGMLAAFRGACAAMPPETVHFEYFSSETEAAADGGFEVVLARSERRIGVARGETILAALTAAGVAIPHSCQQGVCGACEVRVIAGIPDHRDMILDEAERASNRVMMLCCSGSLSDELVIDL